jgi:hypothetical protein
MKMTMDQTQKQPKKVDLDYFAWLTSQINIPRKRDYYGLFEIMHNTEFHWTVSNDDSRMEDGENLRCDYFRFVLHDHYDEGDLELEFVTFLEVLVALSRRLAWAMGDQGNEPYWAWRLIKNLRLTKMSDPLSERKIATINETLYNVIWRQYDRSGEGGFFPLTKTIKDQTKIDIWYQMQEYSMELDPIT